MRLSILTIAVAAMLTSTSWGQGPPGGGGFPGGGFRRGGGGRWDPSQMFDRFANGKEVWLRADANNPWAQGMFDQITQALNITNGQITREQFTAYMQQQRNNWGGRGGRRGNGPGNPSDQTPGTPSDNSGNRGNGADQWAENWFRRLDANGDGLLNYDEMPEALRVERDKWDTNKDGFIDLTEFKAYFQATIQQRMAENGGWNPNWQGGDFPNLGGVPVPAEEEEVKKPVVYHAGNLPKDIPDWFKQIDTDGDGQIGLYEWKASGRALDEFRKIDRNNDGFLTIDEVMRYVADQKKTGGTSSPGLSIAAQNPGNGQGGFGARPNGFQGRNGNGRNRSDPSRGN